MTEDEAKTKWCPFVRVALMRPDWQEEQQPVSPAYNRMHFDVGGSPASDGSERETLCLGAACMAWRETGDHLHRIDTADQRMGYEKAGWAIETTPQGIAAREPRNGYCGLAGAVQ